jgi:hypothetical protein
MRRLALLCLLGLVACDPYADEKDALRAAEERWQDADVDDYTFTLHYSCYCDRYGTFEIVVAADTIVTAERVVEEGEEVEPWMEITAMTIDDMFDRIEPALEREPDDADVRFDRELGYPVVASFDFEDNIADEEWGFGVRSFSPAGRAD